LEAVEADELTLARQAVAGEDDRSGVGRCPNLAKGFDL
jgi:hypothetical protein